MKLKKLSRSTLAASVVAACAGTLPAAAQSVDALLNKLVDKGVLTADEAKALKAESGKSDQANERFSTASWTKNLKFGGDFRGRYDGIWQDDANAGTGSATQDRTRFRYRLRYGVTATLADHFEAGFRLGSGEIGSAAPSLGGSPFSANTTMNNDGSRKFIFVDLAYARWKPADWFSADVGKMASQYWFTDMVLDPDYNPEGAQQKFTLTLNDHHKLGLSVGEYVIFENFNATTNSPATPNKDVYMFMAQADWAAKWSEHLASRLGVGGYAFANQHDLTPALETFLNQNGTSAAGAAAPDFNPIVARGEVTYTFASAPLFNGPFPVTAGFEYVNNPGASSIRNGHDGWNAGLALGDAKKKGNWQLSYNYKHIGTAAVWHGLNDDDFGVNAKGGTGIAGHQVIASYHAFEPLMINARFMRTEQINAPAGVSSEQWRLFMDLLWTF